MDVGSRREAFIPYPRKDIIKLCLADGRLEGETAAAFQAFCTILTAFYHFQFHTTLEDIKENYRVFNPNSDVQPLYEPTLQEYEQMGEKVVEAFKHTLERANYYPMPTETIRQALDSRSLINLKTDVNFDDFEQCLCYYRGDVYQTLKQKKFFFWQTERTIDMLERLVLLVKFKGEGYFRAKEKQSRQRQSERKFVPGKMYVYFYRAHLRSFGFYEKMLGSVYSKCHGLFKQSDRFRMGNHRASVVGGVASEEEDSSPGLELSRPDGRHLLSPQEWMQLGGLAQRFAPLLNGLLALQTVAGRRDA